MIGSKGALKIVETWEQRRQNLERGQLGTRIKQAKLNKIKVSKNWWMGKEKASKLKWEQREMLCTTK